MSLEYVFASNPKHIYLVQSQGFDLEGFLFVCKEAFQVINHLDLQTFQIGEFIKRLKQVYDIQKGKSAAEEMEEFAQRITVMNMITNTTFFFTFFSGQDDDCLFSCDLCSKVVSKPQAKSHVFEHENPKLF